MAAEPPRADLTPDEFSALLAERFPSALNDNAFAAAVSGGPDSMALVKLLSGWAGQNNKTIHALTIDHGLRPESAAEAAQVSEWLKGWPGIRHTVLKWEGEKPQNRIQEEARNARYRLMGEYCAAQGVKALFLAHHQDDQAETFLLRLAMGSGLDGLAAMRAVQKNNSLILLRPFLALPKDRLLATCAAMGVPFVNDPSNKSDNFARVRLRKSLTALEAEGLSSKRLAVTSERLDRARAALDNIAEKAQVSAIISSDTTRIVYKTEALKPWPDEIVLRVLIHAMKTLRPGGEYLPRMEKIESLFRDFISPAAFTKRTLGGLIFERDDREGLLIVSVENMDKAG
ncbi:MAG: tRNA lysidine(34) synthetase TilS [Alphaproteobacteria bacterium]